MIGVIRDLRYLVTDAIAALAHGAKLGCEILRDDDEPLPELAWPKRAWGDMFTPEIEAVVDAAFASAPAALHWPAPELPSLTDAVSSMPKLITAAAIGLREYADSTSCEAPLYWRAIADQLDF